MTLVGLDTPIRFKITQNDRFDEVEAEWKHLTKNCVKGQAELQPILFGGFTFDPQNNVDGEWTDFPEAYFALATFQLVLRDDKAYVSIHLVTKEKQAQEQFEALRKVRDHLIHAAQVKELKRIQSLK